MKQQSSFTLIELLIVVAIIGILAAIAVSNFSNARARALIARAQSDMKGVSSALGCFMADRMVRKPLTDLSNVYPYPSYYEELTTPISYLNKWPVDVWKPEPSGEEWKDPSHYFLEYASDSPYNCSQEYELKKQGLAVRGCYFLASYGPSRTFDSSISARNMIVGAHKIIDFDLSNGLRSRGDLVRMEGDFTGVFMILRNGKGWK